MSIHDDAGVHAALGIEDVLEFAENLHHFRAEHFRQQLRAGNAVAVFAGVRASELGDQVARIEHDTTKGFDALRGAEVEGHAAMDAAFAEVSLVHVDRQLVALEKLIEAAQVLAKPVGMDSEVLGSGPAAGHAFAGRARAEAGFAQSPNLIALARRGKQRHAGNAFGFLWRAKRAPRRACEPRQRLRRPARRSNSFCPEAAA